MIVRAATAEDIQRIVDIWFDSARHHAAIDPERFYLPERESVVERYLAGAQFPHGVSGCVTLVAEKDCEVVGFVDAWINTPFDPMFKPEPYCYVSDLAVAESARSSGIGRRLLSAVEEWAKKGGAMSVVLEANFRNSRAIGLYQRVGYETASITLARRLGTP
jgi:ribosomal protein S18 acetylase RimI-like enzyme